MTRVPNPWRWTGRNAVVTGGSSGIGEGIVAALAEKHVKVIILDKNKPKEDVLTQYKDFVNFMQCDISQEDAVIRVFQQITQLHGGVDILVNNAGIYHPASLTDGDYQDWKKVIEINLLGGSLCTKEALKTMRERGDNGHIININSVLGHMVSQTIVSGSMGYYGPSKYGVTAVCEVLSHELARLKSNIKVTSISPSFTRTPLVTCAEEIVEFPMLGAEDIADGVVYVLSTRPGTVVKELTLVPVGDKL